MIANSDTSTDSLSDDSSASAAERFDYDALAHLHGETKLAADFKTEPADFRVIELMPVTLSGDGEHIWLKITKTGSNTEYVASQLAKFAEVKPVAVSFAGLKDRNAVTTQWFSVQMPGQEGPDWSALDNEEFKIEETGRHSRKLKRGTLSGNWFEIRLRNLSGSQAEWQQRLELIQQQGIPNYFARQRFGHEMGNLVRSEDLVGKNKLRRLKPNKRSIFLSAMRSWVFNQVVSQRIAEARFHEPEQGDVFMLAESQACFSEALNEQILERHIRQEINLTAPLWGRGALMSEGEVARLERSVADGFPLFTSALEAAGMKQERRSMRLLPVNMNWEFEPDNSLVVRFELTKGSYATALLRELCRFKDLSQPVLK